MLINRGLKKCVYDVIGADEEMKNSIDPLLLLHYYEGIYYYIGYV